MKQLRAIISSLCLILGLSIAAYAQESSPSVTIPDNLIVEPFDSYSNTDWEMEKDRLDSFAIMLHQAPNLIGYIVIYAGKRACAGEVLARAIRMKKYLVGHRGVESNRVVWKDAGHLEKPYVILEAYVRGGEPYPFSRPISLPSKDVQVVDCKAKANRQKKRGKA